MDPLLLAGVHAGLTRSEPDGGYVFTHDNVGEAVLAEFGEEPQRRLHLGVGRRSE